jgi:hypothetical protein
VIEAVTEMLIKPQMSNFYQPKKMRMFKEQVPLDLGEN